MSVALHGNLRDFGIGEVFQLIGQQRKTGVLEISDSSQRVAIAFESGAVVEAAPQSPLEDAALADLLVRVGLLTPERLVAFERRVQDRGARFRDLARTDAGLSEAQLDDVQDLLTRETVFSLLRWRQGSFHFTAGSVPSGRDPSRHLPAEQILMDGLRMVDEWRTLDDDVRRDDAVFQRTGRFESYRAAHVGESDAALAAAERLFLLIDGRLSVRRVIDLSRLGTFEGARLLSRLRRAGLVEPVADEALAKRRLRRSVELGPSRSPLHALAALVPFLLLALVAAATWRVPEPVPPPRASLARPAAADPATAFQARRLRNAVEAYRFARGHWPADLRALDELGAGTAPMAGATAAPYYYAGRGESFLVLAPDP